MSTSITLQEMDEATARWIREEARQRGVSVETLILEIIHKAMSGEQEKSQLQTYHDLDSLAGTWTEEQANEFLNAIAYFEQVDEKLWQ